MSNINSIFVKSNDDIENDDVFSDIFKIIGERPYEKHTENRTEKYNLLTENLKFNYDDVETLRLYLGETLYKLDERDNEIINYKKQIKVMTRILEEQKNKIIDLENKLKIKNEVDIDKKEYFKNYS